MLVACWWARLIVPSTERFQSRSPAASASERPGQHTVPSAVSGVAAVTFPRRLSGAEVFTGQVTPGDSSPVAVDDSFDDSTVVLKRSGSLALVRGQQRFDPRPLLISENSVSLLCSHVSTVTVLEWSIKETRPSCDRRPVPKAIPKHRGRGTNRACLRGRRSRAVYRGFAGTIGILTICPPAVSRKGRHHASKFQCLLRSLRRSCSSTAHSPRVRCRSE